MSFPERAAAWLDSAVAAPEHRVSAETPGPYDMLAVISTQLSALIEVQQAILAALGSSSDSRSSVEITVDSKATVKPTVKVYADSDPTAACEQAQELFDDLIIKYGPKTA